MAGMSETMNLDKSRQSLEEEASAITDELTASIDGKEPIGISTPLVDKEGYPRAEIDVYRARHLRKRLNEIKFDHDLIMKKMEGHILEKVSFDRLWLIRRHRRRTLVCSSPFLLFHVSMLLSSDFMITFLPSSLLIIVTYFQIFY
jgi:hypothetical protein